MSRRRGTGLGLLVGGLTLSGTLAVLVAKTDPPSQVPDGPGSTPMSGAVRPGATCEPAGIGGSAGDGTPMVCGADGKWRAAQ
jgi:hypothetical protein